MLAFYTHGFRAGSSPGDLLVAMSSIASEVALVMFETSEGIAKGNWFINSK
jgi:hypothetical protein